MTLWITLLLFFLSLTLSIIASLVLVRSLDNVGAELHLPEGLLGIVTALGADTPEISSAVTALISGNHDLGLGIVLGSNLFNLAALLGLSAIVSGQIYVKRPVLLFNGGVALFATVIVSALIFGWIQPVVCGIAFAILFLPYVTLSAMQKQQLQRLFLPSSIKQFLIPAIANISEYVDENQKPSKVNWFDALTLVPALVLIVLASVGLVQTATTLGTIWHIPHIFTGLFVLATLTGIPNTLAALRLAVQGRGSAVVSESMNSNTLNLLSGIFLPALILGLGTISRVGYLALWWLLGMTLVVILASIQRGLSRWSGLAIIALYLVFVGVVIYIK